MRADMEERLGNKARALKVLHEGLRVGAQPPELLQQKLLPRPALISEGDEVAGASTDAVLLGSIVALGSAIAAKGEWASQCESSISGTNTETRASSVDGPEGLQDADLLSLASSDTGSGGDGEPVTEVTGTGFGFDSRCHADLFDLDDVAEPVTLGVAPVDPPVDAFARSMLVAQEGNSCSSETACAPDGIGGSRFLDLDLSALAVTAAEKLPIVTLPHHLDPLAEEVGLRADVGAKEAPLVSLPVPAPFRDVSELSRQIEHLDSEGLLRLQALIEQAMQRRAQALPLLKGVAAQLPQSTSLWEADSSWAASAGLAEDENFGDLLLAFTMRNPIAGLGSSCGGCPGHVALT